MFPPLGFDGSARPAVPTTCSVLTAFARTLPRRRAIRAATAIPARPLAASPKAPALTRAARGSARTRANSSVVVLAELCFVVQIAVAQRDYRVQLLGGTADVDDDAVGVESFKSRTVSGGRVRARPAPARRDVRRGCHLPIIMWSRIVMLNTRALSRPTCYVTTWQSAGRSRTPAAASPRATR